MKINSLSLSNIFIFETLNPCINRINATQIIRYRYSNLDLFAGLYYLFVETDILKIRCCHIFCSIIDNLKLSIPCCVISVTSRIIDFNIAYLPSTGFRIFVHIIITNIGSLSYFIEV
ncbi:hypothetical protein SDC9_124804 [bioreactor metagenome]|uniref:Uncharacterized protein n=1 Tax=bioreactor metagenome TaxID=1076179 RepID=A0A645CLE5_9ZZZZ